MMVELVVEVVSLEEEEEEEAKDGLRQDRDRGEKELRGAKAQVAIKQHEVVARKSKRAVVVKIFMVVEFLNENNGRDRSAGKCGSVSL
jgi:hypothetical protein